MRGAAARTFQRFFATEAGGGVVLLASAVVALLWANSPWSDGYRHLLETDLTVGAPAFGLTLSLHDWVNDGLMAVFFLLVGLEIKREGLVGELATRRSATLPIAAALGGMMVPAMLYSGVNLGGPGAHGWGIPMATDIAFALGVLAILGNRVPSGLRVFLAALAIADDLGAVLVIAFAYTSSLDWAALGGAAAVIALLVGLSRAGVRHPAGYLLLGVPLWLFIFASGIHATVAGVLLAFTVPARRRPSGNALLHEVEESTETVLSPLQRMEHSLQIPVAYVIMPLFALANAGVTLGGAGAAARSPIALGVALGLLLGKPLGVTLASFIAVRTGAAELPAGVTWRHVHGAGWLAGIGFTMSLFVAGLAFPDPAILDLAKIGVLTASCVAGATGFLLLRRAAV